METDNDIQKKPVSYYGKKIYYINPLIAPKEIPEKNQPQYWHENIEEDKDR